MEIIDIYRFEISSPKDDLTTLFFYKRDGIFMQFILNIRAFANKFNLGDKVNPLNLKLICISCKDSQAVKTSCLNLVDR